MTTTRPYSCDTSTGHAAFITEKTPVRLMSIVRCHESSVRSFQDSGVRIPALLMTTSSRPYAAMVASTMACPSVTESAAGSQTDRGSRGQQAGGEDQHQQPAVGSEL